jgi:hypothetical protein
MFMVAGNIELTPMAVTKLAGLFLKPNALEIPIDIRYETVVWTTKITGMTANSSNLSAFS